jgi:peptide/nickel transport system substrate-binding protein
MAASRRKITMVVGLIGTAAIVLASCSSSSNKAGGGGNGGGGGLNGGGQYGTLPGPHGTPTQGGTLTIAETPGSGPTYIMPIEPEADFSVYTADQFDDYMWRPLWWAPKGYTPEIDYSQSIASGAPTFTDDNKVATINLKSTWKWSDGTPVTSTDVAFYIDEAKAAVIESADNDGAFTPGEFPQDVTSVTTPSPTKIVITLSQAFNQNYQFYNQLLTIIPMPAHAWAKTSANGPIVAFTNPANAKAIYNYLNAASNSLSTYGSNPLWQTVDGPYKIQSFDPSTDGNTMVVNSNYSGPVKPHITEIDNVAFTSYAAEFNELLTGNIDVGPVDFSDFPQVAKLESDGYSVWGYPDFGFNYVPYNFLDKTGDFNHIIAQLYIRQALAHLQDESAVIDSKGIFDGAAGLAYGPAPAVPASPFAPSNALSNPYPFSISTASQLLSSHGWNVVPGGTTTCKDAGTASNECGAGIPAGTPLTWNLIYATQPTNLGTQCEAWASNAKQVGITMTLSSKTFNYITENLADSADSNTDNQWAMQDYGGDTMDLYPTTDTIFNTTGSFNEGGYSDPKADSLINASVYSSNSSAVQNELSYITQQQPALFQPNPDEVTAFKTSIGGPQASFADSSQYQFSPEYWYFTKGSS